MYAPDVCIVPLRFTSTQLIAYTNAGVFQSFVVSGTSIKDPGLALAATQPMNRDRYFVLYNECVVFASKIKLTIYTPAEALPAIDYPCWMWVIPYTDPTSGLFDLVSNTNLRLQRRLKRRHLPFGAQGGCRTISHYATQKQMIPGHSRDGYLQTPATGPAAYDFGWHFGLRNSEGTASGLGTMIYPTDITVTYYCKFSNPLPEKTDINDN